MNSFRRREMQVKQAEIQLKNYRNNYLDNNFNNDIPSPMSAAYVQTSNYKRRANRSHSRKSSPNSLMTQNPMHDDMKRNHIAPGINDKASKIYKKYDSTGRTQN